ncbi:MAG: cofactor assembly of complex C subunit B [Thermosynechococcaceae cyanobacterium MS004]|nr:cofactor assembly of complex C subunit B [Thermosynechococcaceae cyanobacterium MS004]
METLVLPSTFFLSVLIVIGLVFFIRASTKARIETAIWTLPQPNEQVLEEVTHYLENRAYHLQAVDREKDQVVFSGLVQASWGMAIFLSILAAIGAICLGLVLAIQFPALGYWGIGSVILAPGAGWFYFKKSQRPEQVLLTVRPSELDQETRIRVIAHRDEIAAMQSSLNYPAPQE